MSSLPPAEKLPLPVRKNIREKWEANKDAFTKEISDVLGVEWTIDINPNAIYPYAQPGTYSQESLGGALKDYVEAAIKDLNAFKGQKGDDAIRELNSIAFAHVLTMDADSSGRVETNGVEIHEGKLRLLFHPERLNSNIGGSLKQDKLATALNEAPPPAGATTSFTFAAREGIRTDYDDRIEKVRSDIGEILAKPDIKLNPLFEENFAKLQEAAKKGTVSRKDDWDSILGSFTRFYFEAFAKSLRRQNFHEDDMLQEGFHDAVSKGEIAFRIVDSQKTDSSSEVDIDGGVLFIQCTANNWGSNIDNAGSKVVDLL